MSDDAVPVVEAWPVWTYQCPECGSVGQAPGTAFVYDNEQHIYLASVVCENVVGKNGEICGAEFRVMHGVCS